MALGKISKVTLGSRSISRRALNSSRYSTCRTITEGETTRLQFKRYSIFDVSGRASSRRAQVSQSAEHRVDIMANDMYGNTRLAWALFMFNRLATINGNPLRFKKQAKIYVPSSRFIANRLVQETVDNV